MMYTVNCDNGILIISIEFTGFNPFIDALYFCVTDKSSDGWTVTLEFCNGCVQCKIAQV